ncbi:MAG: hypothetical protein LBI39_01860 [Puniceicoccales bacterium]|nr:hypothetical protein [Puniceicoccales bacterium]
MQLHSAILGEVGRLEVSTLAKVAILTVSKNSFANVSNATIAQQLETVRQTELGVGCIFVLIVLTIVSAGIVWVVLAAYAAYAIGNPKTNLGRIRALCSSSAAAGEPVDGHGEMRHQVAEKDGPTPIGAAAQQNATGGTSGDTPGGTQGSGAGPLRPPSSKAPTQSPQGITPQSSAQQPPLQPAPAITQPATTPSAAQQSPQSSAAASPPAPTGGGRGGPSAAPQSAAAVAQPQRPPSTGELPAKCNAYLFFEQQNFFGNKSSLSKSAQCDEPPSRLFASFLCVVDSKPKNETDIDALASWLSFKIEDMERTGKPYKRRCIFQLISCAIASGKVSSDGVKKLETAILPVRETFARDLLDSFGEFFGNLLKNGLLRERRQYDWVLSATKAATEREFLVIIRENIDNMAELLIYASRSYEDPASGVADIKHFANFFSRDSFFSKLIRFFPPNDRNSLACRILEKYADCVNCSDKANHPEIVMAMAYAAYVDGRSTCANVALRKLLYNISHDAHEAICGSKDSAKFVAAGYKLTDAKLNMNRLRQADDVLEFLQINNCVLSNFLALATSGAIPQNQKVKTLAESAFALLHAANPQDSYIGVGCTLSGIELLDSADRAGSIELKQFAFGAEDPTLSNCEIRIGEIVASRIINNDDVFGHPDRIFGARAFLLLLSTQVLRKLVAYSNHELVTRKIFDSENGFLAAVMAGGIFYEQAVSSISVSCGKFSGDSPFFMETIASLDIPSMTIDNVELLTALLKNILSDSRMPEYDCSFKREIASFMARLKARKDALEKTDEKSTVTGIAAKTIGAIAELANSLASIDGTIGDIYGATSAAWNGMPCRNLAKQLLGATADPEKLFADNPELIRVLLYIGTSYASIQSGNDRVKSASKLCDTVLSNLCADGDETNNSMLRCFSSNALYFIANPVDEINASNYTDAYGKATTAFTKLLDEIAKSPENLPPVAFFTCEWSNQFSQFKPFGADWIRKGFRVARSRKGYLFSSSRGDYSKAFMKDGPIYELFAREVASGEPPAANVERVKLAFEKGIIGRLCFSSEGKWTGGDANLLIVMLTEMGNDQRFSASECKALLAALIDKVNSASKQ